MAISATLIQPYVLISPQSSTVGIVAQDLNTGMFGQVVQVYTGGSNIVIVGNNVFFNYSKADQIQSASLIAGANETGVGFIVDENDIKFIEAAV